MIPKFPKYIIFQECFSKVSLFIPKDVQYFPVKSHFFFFFPSCWNSFIEFAISNSTFPIMSGMDPWQIPRKMVVDHSQQCTGREVHASQVYMDAQA